jgi:hypothetical protein
VRLTDGLDHVLSKAVVIGSFLPTLTGTREAEP